VISAQSRFIYKSQSELLQFVLISFLSNEFLNKLKMKRSNGTNKKKTEVVKIENEKKEEYEDLKCPICLYV
jgi:hypothetical protein